MSESQQDSNSENPEDEGWFSRIKWVPTSSNLLENAEKKILAGHWDQLTASFVPIRNGSCRIRTVVFNKDSPRMPLVLVHGMGAGVGLWVLNYRALSRNRPVYAFDLLGFGRSSRVVFPTDPAAAEMELVDSIEEWRRYIGLEKFILAGHSLGGFLAASYSISHPERVRHLALIDPWGFPEYDPKDKNNQNIGRAGRILKSVVSSINPLGAIRAAGPFGVKIIENIRSDLTRKFSNVFDDDTIAQYIYHCNAQEPSGEIAFKYMSESLGWAKHPMIRRISEINRIVPITLVYGSRSWIDNSIGYSIRYHRKKCYVDVQVVKGAGHHVYADRPTHFNQILNSIGNTVDNQLDIIGPTPEEAHEPGPHNRSRARRQSESAVMQRRAVSDMRLRDQDVDEEAEEGGLGSSLGVGLGKRKKLIQNSQSMGVIEDREEDDESSRELPPFQEEEEPASAPKFSVGQDDDEDEDEDEETHSGRRLSL